MKKVAIVIGSDSDMPIAEKAYNTLKEYGVPATVHILSAHRTPEEAKELAVSARDKGYGAIIAGAGMAAHLAGAIAANTTLPVIGIPIKSGELGGMDALLSTVMMPSGIPVATVAINGGANAAILAAQMLAITDTELQKTIESKREANAAAVLKKNRAASEKFN